MLAAALERNVIVALPTGSGANCDCDYLSCTDRGNGFESFLFSPCAVMAGLRLQVRR